MSDGLPGLVWVGISVEGYPCDRGGVVGENGDGTVGGKIIEEVGVEGGAGSAIGAAVDIGVVIAECGDTTAPSPSLCFRLDIDTKYMSYPDSLRGIFDLNAPGSNILFFRPEDPTMVQNISRIMRFDKATTPNVILPIDGARLVLISRGRRPPADCTLQITFRTMHKIDEENNQDTFALILTSWRYR